MGKVAFFSIPAYGHTNPTIEVVRTISGRGHTVCYYSFEMFREQIEATGARYLSCDAYMPPVPEDFERRIRYDFASLIQMTVHVTLGMEDTAFASLKELQPDCIVSDSMCIWGKLYAKKLGIPLICSTTTFAFNQQTAAMMKPGFREMLYSIMGMPKINRCIKQLRSRGYEVNGLVDLIQNDNETDTIVYTSKLFQPASETFSGKYAFVGPSLPPEPVATGRPKPRPLVYVSLGTLIQDRAFYRNCIDALQGGEYDVIMSVGSAENAALLRDAPAQFQIESRVAQREVLQRADVFITHCGMNSVNESIYYEVPMVLFPQQSEQKSVAQRAGELGAGLMLKGSKPTDILNAVSHVLNNRDQYLQQIRIIANSFRAAGGAEKAADKIERLIYAGVDHA